LKIGLVLLQQSAARLGVLFLRHGILKIGLFESVEGNDNAIDFGQRLIEIPFSGRRSKFDFLHDSQAAAQLTFVEFGGHTSSRLIVAVRDSVGV